MELLIQENGISRIGLELKVGKITEANFQGPLQQARRYSEHFGIPAYLVNFWLEGCRPPWSVGVEGVELINVKYNSDCTLFTVAYQGCTEIVHVSSSMTCKSHGETEFPYY